MSGREMKARKFLRRSGKKSSTLLRFGLPRRELAWLDDHFNSPDIQDNRQTLQPTVSEQLGGDAAPAPDLPTPSL